MHSGRLFRQRAVQFAFVLEGAFKNVFLLFVCSPTVRLLRHKKRRSNARKHEVTHNITDPGRRSLRKFALSFFSFLSAIRCPWVFNLAFAPVPSIINRINFPLTL